ncbi:hypothetical protein I307_03698 [Cryptococcus deuterogattii 99/473]|uniref:Uncharacterized protein n=1 Tax=Cryptococcus deuterogattii Ram5 TaxID=1296110 RepID=A0A0D0TAZ8_9TREE|nr:hypothetical protein I309_00725 [Cryptococcus deuterogattii LA55]KIR36751.1 hypothetical protein I352_00062 [Cryptococcus deuterogattii MMRL2647]KIR43222.1 hypothetical protein I313_00063 [Cryptococcus deuterogattii Ram5]KIR92518.1 hypothetical protein I304_03923 [Cryptococcus deuterogattii CBS 10090]KIS01684.1 hypothetical protein L804_01563 [Cryptococcus deuterogattii 2001/935-1]KIY56960.1 hypothetical protein I307_03698 [Cryptococcus deuterogattii 99/473]
MPHTPPALYHSLPFPDHHRLASQTPFYLQVHPLSRHQCIFHSEVLELVYATLALARVFKDVSLQ